ncbi:MAG: DUF190 domain-containing protein [Gammaproteobacteria bacterium]|nr:DUF190 domain-containing protein [Gammaproteobacteria bacterium]
MRGFQITFFTHQDRRHEGKPLGEWLILLARQMGLSGATLMSATEGFGASGKLHSARFFDLADQPIEILVTVSEQQAEKLFERLRAEGLHLAFVKTAVEFGRIGEDDR